MSNPACGQTPDPRSGGSKEPKWFVAGGRLLEPTVMTDGIRAGLMGIVNLTPDSFYDGGAHEDARSGIDHALALHRQGADILDLGAESTRPGARQVSEADETSRLLPVLLAIKKLASGSTISIDTRHPGTAACALAHGAEIVNDVSGLPSQAMLEVLATYKPGYVLTHSYGCPANVTKEEDQNKNILETVCDFFEQGMAMLVKAGLPENRIILDPGIGFGKTASQGFCILANVESLLGLGRPVLVGLSMKSLFGELLGLPTNQRGVATAVATALLHSRGTVWHRVHDVAVARQAILVATTLAGKNDMWPNSGHIDGKTSRDLKGA